MDTNELLAVATEMRARQVARGFKSQTLIAWADRIEAAAALSGREAAAHRWKRDGEVVGPWIDGAPSDAALRAMDACAPMAAWAYELAYSAPTTPQPGDGVVVPRWLLEQVYGMACEGCESPTVGYRWCERIDSIMHGAEPESEYAAWARPLPAKFPAAPSAKGVDPMTAFVKSAPRSDNESPEPPENF